MRRFFRLIGFILFIVACLALWKREELTRLYAVVTLFDTPRITENFSHMDRAFLTKTLPIAGQPMALPIGTGMTRPEGAEAWIAARDMTALVVLHRGQIVDEAYFKGTVATDRRIAWSVSKGFVSALFGIVLNEGAIKSIDEDVTNYVPALKGSAYDGTALRHILTMSSGIAFNEDYLDFNSDINKMGRVLALGRSMDDFAESRNNRDRPAGEAWAYVSIDTHVLGMAIRGATGQDMASLLSEKLIIPLGLEVAPTILTDGLGEPFVLGGLNLITRDYARFGQLFLQRGAVGGRQIVPSAWVEASTTRQANTPEGAIGYGFQWWVPPGAEPGEFMARGIYGQYIYVNRLAEVVIAVNAADRNFRAPGVAEENIAMFRKIAASLKGGI